VQSRQPGDDRRPAKHAGDPGEVDQGLHPRRRQPAGFILARQQHDVRGELFDLLGAGPEVALALAVVPIQANR